MRGNFLTTIARPIAAALLMVVAAAGAARADDLLRGHAIAVDGDTLLVAGERIRLFGIDAPEMATVAGWRARRGLDDLLHGLGGTVECTAVDEDRYQRHVAVCIAGAGVDLAASMLRTGWATVYRTYAYGSQSCDPAESAGYTKIDYALSGCLGPPYDEAERRAQLDGAGLWSQPGL